MLIQKRFKERKNEKKKERNHLQEEANLNSCKKVVKENYAN